MKLTYDKNQMEKMVQKDVLLKFQHTLQLEQGQSEEESLRILYKEILDDDLRRRTYLEI